MTLPAYSPGGRPPRRPGNPAQLACTVAQTAVDVVLGADRLDQLNRWVSPVVRDSLAQQQSLARRAGRTGASAARVERARVCRVSDVAAEVSVVVSDGQRSRAVALRLEALATRWVVTTLLIG